jgi:hypothetical protein
MQGTRVQMTRPLFICTPSKGKVKQNAKNGDNHFFLTEAKDLLQYIVGQTFISLGLTKNMGILRKEGLIKEITTQLIYKKLDEPIQT